MCFQDSDGSKSDQDLVVDDANQVYRELLTIFNCMHVMFYSFT